MREGVEQVALAPFVRECHAHLLERWLRAPHVSCWWGDPDETLGEIAAPPPAGGEALIVADGSPVGYVRWQAPDRGELDAAGLTDVSEDAVDIDIAIGEPDYLDSGVGRRALRSLCDRLVEEGAHTIMLATSVDNRRAIRAYEEAGFARRRRFDDPGRGPHWLMVLEPRLGERAAGRIVDHHRLEDLPNVGTAIAAKLRAIDIEAPSDLVGRDPYALYEELNARMGTRHDPCLLDVFISVTCYVAGEPAVPWWSYTGERKATLGERAGVRRFPDA
jgi:RimJ/RimL family protein N-acetyltransferase